MAYTTVNKSTDYFNTKLYTGNSGTQSITGVGFQPDLVWGKSRSGILYHILSDVVRGATKRIFSNDVSAEETSANTITSFDSDGFSVGSNADINGNSQTQVAWNWKANGAGSANTAGSISSTVSANTTSGFSIVKYTGTGANATVGHGLGIAPKMLILKDLSSTQAWSVYHKSMGYGSFIGLNSSAASSTSTTRFTADPSSSVFSIGNNASGNGNGNNFIAYCFADVQGFSKFGSYVGNSSTDGTFVYTGFKPAFVILKRTDGADSWVMLDNKRNEFNVIDKQLITDGENAETTLSQCDFLSNGFKLKIAGGLVNGNGNNHIYMAFAEAPLVGSNNVPCTAR